MTIRGRLCLSVVLLTSLVGCDSSGSTITSLTVGKGKVAQSNTGHPCTSGRLLHVQLVGSFPHIVTTGGVGGDSTVRTVLITADAGSGEVCEIGVRTVESTPATIDDLWDD